ncbi:MAG: helicase-exonuclease AddAB subunit AddA [Eubacteriales bacterium]|nr:helicase-exonuclease AddAB subunit AddA [Eubacteriales bacterium]
MANQWTDEQKAAFTLSERNILVAAAAGSGKTAVLVERIIKKITDSRNPVNVDELVVVTFTKAAAAEMKQRIRVAIDALVEQQPDNMHLVKQLTLLNNAQICTIDSFCLGIIRNYFTEVDLDPCFRTADEAEIKLLENDIMEDMLEEYYASENQDFFDFVDSYATGRNDASVEEMILKLYGFARSNPWPQEWYDMCLLPYTASELEESSAVKFLYKNIMNVLADYETLYTKMAEICRKPQGPLMYVEAVESDLAGIRQLLMADSFAELGRRVRLISFDALGRKKIPDVSEDMKKYVKDMRDSYKKYVTDILLSKIFVSEPGQILKDLEDNRKAVLMLVKLTKDFESRILKEKRQRNIIDFNDMEHLALDILVSYDGGEKKCTEVAKKLAYKYNEIMIDEYQDSNLLQEAILTAVSKSAYEDCANNIYMVGDVKQSIYKFRLACPDLFIDKYDRYKSFKAEESAEQKIELQMNFRSRKNVLESCNDVFKRVMNKKFCGIEYDDSARLNAGFPYPEADLKTEAVLINTPEASGRDARETEGAYIADRIKALMEDGQVYDARKGQYREIRYSDIVILTRSVKDWADVFVNELMDKGIPAYCESNGGYFATFEIKVLLNFLSIIDNPTKDIEMSGVMLSYFGGFTIEELAIVRNGDKSTSLFNQLVQTAQKADLPPLCIKAKEFVDKINIFRKKSEYMSIQELVWEVVYATGYFDYVGTMPAGRQRQANIDILLQRAGAYERSSYSGLFNFLRYVERMKKSDIDYGEASVLGENDNLVRVMSIHKSKGLEFPVVFVAGMHKKMNFMDAAGSIVVDGNLGIGMDVVRLDKRTKGKTVVKAAIARKIVQDTIAEEQRVLYVAMTRAREKLIMTGVDKDMAKAVDKWKTKAGELEVSDAFTFLDNENFKTYFDMVMPVAFLPENKNLGGFEVCVVEDEKISSTEGTALQALTEETSKAEADDKGNEKDVCMDSYPPYEYEPETSRKLKITVSELKTLQHEQDFDSSSIQEASLYEALKDNDEEDIKDTVPVPEFIAGRCSKLAGNERGTAYHRMMECLDYNKTSSIEEIRQSMQEMVSDERMTRIQADSIDVEDIFKFCSSNLGMRIKAAIDSGLVKREQPFVFKPQKGAVTNQLVQGVIDLYFEEAEELVIVDYKTDHVRFKNDGEALLKERYAVQLDYYAMALEQITGKKVREKIIYSFDLGKEIVI